MLANQTQRFRILLVLASTLGTFSPLVAADPVKWRTDYNTARREAQERGLPLLIEIGTDDCFYCKKLDATSFKDPAIVALLGSSFIPLKIDANREPQLARTLKIQVYPTLVLAGADGKIHAFIEGYMEPARLGEHMARTVTAASTTDGAARDYNEATKAISTGDYPRGVSLLKGVIREAGHQPVGVKAKQVLDQVEKQAEGQLAQAKEFDSRGQMLEASEKLTELMRSYSGTIAAADAATFMAGLTDKPEAREQQRLRRARDLLASAKEEFRSKRFYDCLQKCERISESSAGLPEATEATVLAAEITSHPERLAAACEQMTDRTAAMYLALAESWQKKGQDREAADCLEKVMKLSPNSTRAQLAQTQLRQIQGKDPAMPAGFQRTP